MSVSIVVSAADAVSVIGTGDVVATSGWGGHGVAETVLKAIESRFLSDGSPSDLTLVWAGGQGDGAERGLNHLGHAGLLKRTIGGHYGLIPRIVDLAVEEAVEAYNFPEGVILNLFRNTAGGAPGVLTSIGMGTFVDPRLEGGSTAASPATRRMPSPVSSWPASCRRGHSPHRYKTNHPINGQPPTRFIENNTCSTSSLLHGG